MSIIRTRSRPQGYEATAIVLAALGIIVLPVVPYVALALSLIAAGMMVVSVWVRHQPRTRWRGLATLLIVVGLVVQLGYVLTAPVAATAHNGSAAAQVVRS